MSFFKKDRIKIKEAFTRNSQKVKVLGEVYEIKEMRYIDLTEFLRESKALEAIVNPTLFLEFLVKDDKNFKKFLKACFNEQADKIDYQNFNTAGILTLVDIFYEVNNIGGYLVNFTTRAQKLDAKLSAK